MMKVTRIFSIFCAQFASFFSSIEFMNLNQISVIRLELNFHENQFIYLSLVVHNNTQPKP